ncbi:MAG: YoeB-YefM toxin-antitoxin system antitoxin YefM [Thermodesulfobacteriota bacterium]
MKTITYSEARQKLSKTMNEVIEAHAPVTITRSKGKGDVVLMSLEEYESLQETFYLLKSPKNAKRLLESIKELEAGKGIVKELIE